jgi:hypothetical protein
MTSAGSHAAPGCIAGRPACVEPSMASAPDGRSVVPHMGDTWQERSARCQRQPSQATCVQRRSPSSFMYHQRRSVAGRRRAGCPSSAPWAATDATPTGRSGPCWKPSPSHPRPASHAPRLTARHHCRSWLGSRSGSSSARSGSCRIGGTADFLCARDNPGHRTTRGNARKRLLTWAVG